MAKYTYSIANDTLNGKVELGQLQNEIGASAIITAIDYCQAEGDVLDIWFKAALSAGDETILNGVVSAHDGIVIHEPALVHLDSPSTTEDGVPIVLATAKPENHYTCFQGAGDSPTHIGRGLKCIFRLADTDTEISKDFTFNEDIYIKDGYMITKNAPMGASVDIDIVQPGTGYIVGTFGREIPVFGSGWFPLNTNDRGKLPQGIIMRVTVHNANGSDDEDPAAAFSLAGRFETYRPTWGVNGTPLINR